MCGALAMGWCIERGLTRGDAPNADFFDFYWAANAVRHGGDLWTSGDGGYIYPPFLAVVLAPWSLLAPKLAATFWTLLMSLCLLMSLDLCVRIAARVLEIELQRRERLAAAALAFLPLVDCVRRELEWSNCNPLIILAWSAGLWWLTRRPALSGIALGVAAMIKYLPLGMLPLLFLRRRLREACWMIACLVALALAPAIVRGWERNLEDLAIALGGLARMAGLSAPSRVANIIPIDADYSHSITSGLARLVRDGELAPPMLFVGAAIALALTGAAWLFFCRRVAAPPLAPWWSAASAKPSTGLPARMLLAECLFAIAMSLALSPQTQKRHLNFLVPVTAVLAVLWLRGSRRTRWWMFATTCMLTLGATIMPNTPLARSFIEDTWKYIGGPGWVVLACTVIVAWRLVAPSHTARTNTQALTI